MNCSTGCSACDKTNGCTACVSGYTLDAKYCKKDSGCDESCATCLGPASDECFSCVASKILVQGKCVAYSETNVNKFFTDLKIIPHMSNYA